MFCTAFGALSLSGTVAIAFDQSAVSSVSDKPNKYYTAQGGRFRSLIVRPSIEIEEIYDDNIFRQADNKQNDFITVVKPSLDIETNWNLHQIKAGVSGKIGRYSDNDNEDYNDYSYYVSGRYDIDYATYLTLNLKSEYRHEDRGSLDDVNGDEPTEYNQQTGSVGFIRELGALKLYLTGIFQSISYEDSNRGGVVINNNDRDRTQRILRARLAYSLSDDFDIFMQAQSGARRYDLSSNSPRNSNSYDYRAGLSMNITGKAQGDIYLGYINYKYGAGFEDVNSLNYGCSLLWDINGITSLEGSLERQVVETTLSGSSAVINTNANISIEHGLMDNIILDGYIGFDDDKYEGDAASSSRDNIMYLSGVGAQYRLDDNVSIHLGYDYINRDSKQSSRTYDNHKMLLSIRYEY